MNYKESIKLIKKWEVAGLIFMIIVGPLLHFTYEWSGYNPIVGMFCPVNESVWEHLKLGFSSLLIFSIFEYFYIKNQSKNFFTAKIAGAVAQEIIIVAIFYAYTSITGRPILFVDISSYVFSCMICQLISYKILTGRTLKPIVKAISIFLIILNAVSFAVFTYFTPTLPIFKDPHSNSYGTHWNSNKK